MARQPASAPSQADGKDVGALDRDKTDWASTFNDIRDYGAQMDGSTNDATAIEDALKDSTASGEAAYIPADGGTAALGQVDIDSAMNGAILVGDGYDSLTRNETGERQAFNITDSSSTIDVTLANFRHDGNYPDVTAQHWAIDIKNDGISGNSVSIENVWAHDCEASEINVEKAGVTVDHCSVWGANTWHGISIHETDASTERRDIKYILSWENGQYGIDASNGDMNVQYCMCIANNHSGMKTSSGGQDIDITNVHLEDNVNRGFNMTGTTSDLYIDQMVAIYNNDNNNHPGITFAYGSTVTAGDLYATNDANHGVRVHGDTTTLDITLIEACDNSLDGIHFVDPADGTIDTVRGSGNRNLISGSTGDVTINNRESAACDVPDVIPDQQTTDFSQATLKTSSSGRLQTSSSGRLQHN